MVKKARLVEVKSAENIRVGSEAVKLDVLDFSFLIRARGGTFSWSHEPDQVTGVPFLTIYLLIYVPRRSLFLHEGKNKSQATTQSSFLTAVGTKQQCDGAVSICKWESLA